MTHENSIHARVTVQTYVVVLVYIVHIQNHICFTMKALWHLFLVNKHKLHLRSAFLTRPNKCTERMSFFFFSLNIFNHVLFITVLSFPGTLLPPTANEHNSVKTLAGCEWYSRLSPGKRSYVCTIHLQQICCCRKRNADRIMLCMYIRKKIS